MQPDYPTEEELADMLRAVLIMPPDAVDTTDLEDSV